MDAGQLRLRCREVRHAQAHRKTFSRKHDVPTTYGIAERLLLIVLGK